MLAPADGIVTAVDAELIGKACLVLGAGRQKTDDAIDPAVGIAQMKKPGEEVKKGEPLAVIFSNDRNLPEADQLFGNAFELGDAFDPAPLICEVI